MINITVFFLWVLFLTWLNTIRFYNDNNRGTAFTVVQACHCRFLICLIWPVSALMPILHIGSMYPLGCDRFDTIHTLYSNCFLGLYLSVCKHTIPFYLVIFQVTGKCLSPYLSKRKRPNSTKDKRKVSNPSCTDFYSLSTPSFAVTCSSYCHWCLWWKLRCFLIGHLMGVSGTHLTSCVTLQDVFPCWLGQLMSHLDKVVWEVLFCCLRLLRVLESTRPGVEIPV